MQHHYSRTCATIALLIVVSGAQTALAGSGLLPSSTDASSKGLAGAGMAMPRDAMAMSENPAAIAFVDNTVVGGAAILIGRPEFSGDGPGSGPFPLEPGTLRTERVFVIPHTAASRKLNESSTISAGVYGFFGLGASFPNIPRTNCPLAPTSTNSGPLCGGATDVEFNAAFISATYAHKIKGNISVGISPIVAYSRIKLNGLGFFAIGSTDPAAVSNNGWDDAFGFGGQVGIHYDGDRVSAGASYQSKIEMSAFDDYAGVFADNGKVDLPAIARFGVAADVSKNTTLALDVEHVFYSGVPAFANEFVFPAAPGNPLLGEPDGAGFGYDNQTIIQFGVQHRINQKITIRGGGAYSTAVIQDDQLLFNVIAPGNMQYHVAGGFAYQASKRIVMDVGISYTPTVDTVGPNELSQDQNISLAMRNIEVGFGISYRY